MTIELSTINNSLPSTLHSPPSTIHLPSEVSRLHGCLNCEWRGTPLCPYGIKIGVDVRLHDDGVCRERLAWLEGFSPEGVTVPTYFQWKESFNSVMQQVVLTAQYNRLVGIENKIRELELVDDNVLDDNKKKQHDRLLGQLHGLRARYWNEWFMLVNSIRKHDGDKITRESPKKVEIDVQHVLKVSDINRILREAKQIEEKTKVIEINGN